MEGEELTGWLIPFDKAIEYELIWKVHQEDDKWIDYFVFVYWEERDQKIVVRFES